MRLNRATVSRLSIPEGRTEAIIFDEALPGFGIRLRAGGKRTWIAQYRLGTKQRRLSLGNAQALDAEEARKLARKALSSAHLGNDPQEQKTEIRSRAAVTLGVVAESYLARAEQRLKPASFVEVKRYLRSAWAPLHEAPIYKVSRADVSARLGEILRDHGPYSANRARAALSKMYAWAIGEGIPTENPVIGTNRPADEIARDRVLSDHELRAVWRHAGEGDYGDIIRLLILTGERREEVGGMRWQEINGDWAIPGERTKNGLAHDVPITPPMREILDARVRMGERELVFGSGTGGFSGWSKGKAALDKRLEGSEQQMPDWRLHDIRRTFATRISDLGVLPHVVESMLNHVSGHKRGVAGIYNRSPYAAERRAAMNLWSEFIMALVAEPAKS
jgi:integrase